jgi:hypothetical protein
MAEPIEAEALSGGGIPEGTLTQGTNPIPRLKMGETGFNGLRVIGGIPYEECQRELSFPQSIATFKKMSKDGTIAPALNIFEMMMARVDWYIEIPKGYEQELALKAKYLQQVMEDMDHSWGTFVRQATSFNRFGFAPFEKVFRKRLKANGSKYDDGLFGLKKLSLISQDTVVGFEWENEGRDLSAVWQAVNKPQGVNQSTYFGQDTVYGDKVKIPRKKFILFRNQVLKDDPLGQSSLVGAYESWKYKKSLEQVEASGISQDINGFKVLYIPPQYMSEDATPENKEVYEHYKHIMRNIHVGKQSGLILPQIVDDSGNEYFKFEVTNVSGTKSYDTDKIIRRYQNEILTALTADFLILGQGGGGSYALSENKITISETAIEAKLLEIQDQLNHDLVKQLFALNGWDTSVTPRFKFGKVEKQDLDVLSKYLQRLGAIGMLPKTQESVNWVADQVGMPYTLDEDMDKEEWLSNLTGYTSGASEGMEKGAGNGTSDSVSDQDNSTANLENP